MNNELPLYADLILGGLYLFMFTGTWLIVNDLANLLTNTHLSAHKPQIALLLKKIRFRRIMGLTVAIGWFALYFFNRAPTVLVAIPFGLFWLDTLGLASRSRDFVREITGQGRS